MKRAIGLTLLTIGAVSLAGAWAVRLSPPRRTKAYFALERGWSPHRAEQRPNWLLSTVEPAFEPFVPVRVNVEPGMNMVLDPYDLVSRTILETGQWEKESWDAIERYLPPGGTFVDVGAHIGYYSLKAARVVGRSGHVISVEPNPETVAHLRENIRASDANMVTVAPVACSDTDAVLDLFAAARHNTGESSLSRNNAQQAGGVETVYHVPARPLDKIIQEAGVPRVDVIKIDVEGAELLVLKGAGRTLDQYHPVIITELLEHQLASMGASIAQVKELLAAHGYAARQNIADNVVFTR